MVYPVVCILSLVANAVMWIAECALLELGGPDALDDVSTEIGDPGRGVLVIVRSDGVGTWNRRQRHPALNLQLIQRFDRIVFCALNLLEYRVSAAFYKANGGLLGIMDDEQILEITASFVVAAMAWFVFDSYTSTHVFSFMSSALIGLFPKSYNAMMGSLVLRYMAGAITSFETLLYNLIVFTGCRFFRSKVRRSRKYDKMRDDLQQSLLAQRDLEICVAEKDQCIRKLRNFLYDMQEGSGAPVCVLCLNKEANNVQDQCHHKVCRNCSRWLLNCPLCRDDPSLR